MPLQYPDFPDLNDSNGRPLPSLDDIQLDPDGRRVWPLLLSAEQAILRSQRRPTAESRNTLVAIRVVGWMLIDFRTYGMSAAYVGLRDAAVKCLNVDVQLEPGHPSEVAKQYQKVIELGLLIRNFLTRGFRSVTDPTLESTSDSDVSRPSFEQRQADFLTRLKDEKGSQGRTYAEAKADALFRDGYRCVVTGRYDQYSYQTIREVKAEVNSKSAYIVDTQLAHIFTGTAQNEYASEALSLLKMFGMDSLAEKLLWSQAMFNIMTLHPSIHWDWDDLMFWFEPVPGQEHTYKLIPRDPNSWLRSEPQRPQQVTFRVDPRAAQYCEDNQIDPKEIELPHPSLLALRAACTRVANMSGVVFVQ
ncbi:hypothetical protein R3P38DRAFT_3258876 [Favolaschia claudopus]|uniref:HNH nuclease domain-containing protein n=1 Tax=Favolaschia claudopus TaxID=2862362 RepID=A0AAW0D045_9AGAR